MSQHGWKPDWRLSTVAAALAPISLILPGSTIGAQSSFPLRFAGAQGELVISQVSERTARVQFFPLSSAGIPRLPELSTILVSFSATEKLRSRALEADQECVAGKLRVLVKPHPLTIVFRRDDGSPVQELVFDDGAITNAGIVFRTSGPVLGLGEGAQQFDRRGALYTMEPSWGGWNRPLLGSVVPSPFIIGTEGWALFAHRPEGQFDLREASGKFIPRQDPDGGAALDLFVMDVREPAAALAEYIRLTGRPVLPPKWALGYFQSHRTLSGPEEPLTIAKAFREKKLPCDALIYLGTGYCTNGWNTGHGSLEFNTNAFKPENIQALHDLNFKVVLHVNHAPRDLFGASVTEESDSPLHIRNYWERHRSLAALGVDGWWPDDGDELPLEARLTRHRCYYEGPLLDRPTMRPWSLHRTGYAGVQRYGGWIWSGDIDGKWATLASQVSVGLNHGLSLTPFWGTDTGGFFPTPELTGELYARWFQFSAFCPSFRAHGRTWHLRLPWGWDTGEFGPIEHPRNQHPDSSELHNADVEPICRSYLELRYRLLPYNYTLAREASDTGLPMMRALWLQYPGDAQAAKLGDEYLWGRDLLVAPVVEKGLKSRRLYLPEGDWYDWWTGSKLAGKRWINRDVDLATLPLFVRAGTVLPMDPVRQYTSQPVTDPTVLCVYPGADGTFVLYDDDGQSNGYRDGSDGKTIWIRMKWIDASRRLRLEPDSRMKQWPGGARKFTVKRLDAPGLKELEFRGLPVEVQL